MKLTGDRHNDWFRIGFALLLLAVGLPVLAVLLFVARFVLLGIAVAAVVGGAVAYSFSGRFRDWLEAFGEQEFQYKGLRLATDVGVAPVHSWARIAADGVLVGSDDVAPTVLGPLSAVELPELGCWYRRGEPIVHLRRGARRVALRAPVSGVVVGRNEALHRRPELVNDDPYADGWLVRLRSDGAGDDRSWLRRGRRARAWFRVEVDRLVGTLLHREEVEHAVADGGQLVGQLYRQIGEVDWERVTRSFFDCRSADRDARGMDEEPVR